MSRSPEALTAERGTTHGDYPTMSKCVMDIMRVYESALNWDSLPETVQVFLFNNAQKCARILTGNPYEPDHYDDIAGYAHLARKSVTPEPVPGVGAPGSVDLAAAPVSTQAPDLSTLPGSAQSAHPSTFVGGKIDASQVITSDLRGSATEPVVIYPDGRALDLSTVLAQASGFVTSVPAQTSGTAGDTLGSVGDPVTTQGAQQSLGTAPGEPAETAPTSQEGDAGLAPLGRVSRL